MDGIRTTLHRLIPTVLVVGLTLTPGALQGQAFFFDASVDQAYGSDPLPAPVGFSLAVGRTSILGPLGIHAGIRSLFEDGADEIAQHCGFASCTPGPFDQSYTMRQVYVGLSYDFANPTDVYLNLGLNVGRNQQTEHLTHLGSGEVTDVAPDGDISVGGSLDLRLRPFLGPFRPAFSGRYDRIFGGSCPADGLCLPSRDVWSLSVGLSLVAPAG